MAEFIFTESAYTNYYDIHICLFKRKKPKNGYHRVPIIIYVSAKIDRISSSVLHRKGFYVIFKATIYLRNSVCAHISMAHYISWEANIYENVNNFPTPALFFSILISTLSSSVFLEMFAFIIYCNIFARQ